MKQYRNLIKPYLVWAFVVIVIPLILIALYAFTEDGNEVLRSLLPWRISANSWKLRI